MQKHIHSNNYLPEGCRIATAANAEACASWQALESAMSDGVILEGVATMCDRDLNLIVSVGGFLGMLPREEVAFSADGEEIKDIAVISRVGKPICFCVTGMLRDAAPGEPQLLLSRRRAQRECHARYVSHLQPGDVIPARVTHLETFGAFVDIGCGVVSLLSVDCISVSRIRHPSDRLYAGMMIRTVVKVIDSAKNRLYVSMRELLGTWEENAARFCAGQTVTGIVRSVEPYGVFVELAPNLAGLTELKEEFRAILPQCVGQCAAVFIKSICPERMKIKLVLIDTYPDARRGGELCYFVPEGCTHLDRWVYSPPASARTIETVFTPEQL